MTNEEMMTWGGHRGSDMTSYEHFAIAEKTSKRASNTSITGLAIGVGAAVVGIGAWIFSGITSKAWANGNAKSIDILAQGLLTERSERNAYTLANNPSLKAYIDVATGGASAGANAGATSNATVAQLLELAAARNGQVCPQPVSLWNPATPRTDCCDR